MSMTAKENISTSNNSIEQSSLVHPQPTESAWSVFLIFLRLGLTSFGGPVAHLGYFRD